MLFLKKKKIWLLGHKTVTFFKTVNLLWVDLFREFGSSLSFDQIVKINAITNS